MPPSDIDRVQGDLKDPAFQDFKLRPVGVNLWEVTHLPSETVEVITCYEDWTAFRDGILETAGMTQGGMGVMGDARASTRTRTRQTTT